MDDTTWTPPKLLTFYVRMILTFKAYWMPLPMLAAWLQALWSSGATVSFHPIDPPHVSLRIASGNGLRNLTVTREPIKETTV